MNKGNKMRVLLMDVNCKYSSTGKIVYDLYTQLNAEGHTAAIAYGRGPIVQEKNIYRFAPEWEVYLHTILTRFTGYTGCFSPVATWRLLKYIEEFRPDIVHLNDMHGYFVNIIPLIKYLKKKDIKTVWTFHCEFMYTGKCGYAYKCEKWKNNCGKCPQLQEYPKSLFHDCTEKMLQKKKEVMKDWDNLSIVTPSDWLKDRVSQSFLKQQKIIVIHNSVNTDVFCPKENTSLKERYDIGEQKIILAVAPDLMSERKGGKFVLQLADEMKEDNVKFFLIGAEERLDVVGENIIFGGTVKDEYLLAEYYSMADVFLICSRKETFSMTTAEALCCGTPVVGFKAGAPETIAYPEYSIFVDYGDVMKLKDAVKKMLTKSETLNRAEIALKSREKFNLGNMLRGYLTIYQSMNATTKL